MRFLGTAGAFASSHFNPEQSESNTLGLAAVIALKLTAFRFLLCEKYYKSQIAAINSKCDLPLAQCRDLFY